MTEYDPYADPNNPQYDVYEPETPVVDPVDPTAEIAALGGSDAYAAASQAELAAAEAASAQAGFAGSSVGQTELEPGQLSAAGDVPFGGVNASSFSFDPGFFPDLNSRRVRNISHLAVSRVVFRRPIVTRRLPRKNPYREHRRGQPILRATTSDPYATSGYAGAQSI